MSLSARVPVKLILAALALLLASSPTALAQNNPPAQQSPDWQTAAGGKLSFDVATIRPSKPETWAPPNFALSTDDSYTTTHGTFTADFPLDVYIEFAYKIWLSPEQRDTLFAHLPKWTTTQSFTIHAHAPGEPTKDQMRLMVQSLLADRFKLVLHFETQQVPVLALTVLKPGKLGPNIKLHSLSEPCDVLTVPDGTTPSSPASHGNRLYPCDTYAKTVKLDHTVTLSSRNTTMPLLAKSLVSIEDLGRPVIDQTGLTDRYDFALNWTPTVGPPPPPGASPQDDTQTPAEPNFFTSLKEQLGLTLKPSRAPLPVPVIDHIEQPSEN